MALRRPVLILLATPVVGLAALGVVLTPFAALIPLLVLVPALAGMVGYALAAHRAGDDTPETPLRTDSVHRRGVRQGLIGAGGAAAAVLVVAGLVSVAGSATGPVLLLAGLAAIPWAWGRAWLHLDRRALGRRDGGSGTAEPNPAPGPRPLVRILASLSTPALCAEWERSLQVLREATEQSTRDDVAELRRRYLDELERRDPEALERWLASDARPAGTNPARHLSAADGTGERDDRYRYGHRADGDDHPPGTDHVA